MAQLSSSKARAVALAMSGAAAVASFPTAAEAFTERQCALMQVQFGDYIRVNVAHFSATDKAELIKFSTWMRDGGCVRGDRLVLVRHPEVGAALGAVQAIVNRSPDVSLRVNLSPTVSFVPYDTAAVRPTAPPQSATPTPISARPGSGG